MMMKLSDRRALRQVREHPDLEDLCRDVGGALPAFAAELARTASLVEAVADRYRAGGSTPRQDGALSLWCGVALRTFAKMTVALTGLNERLARML